MNNEYIASIVFINRMPSDASVVIGHTYTLLTIAYIITHPPLINMI